MAVDDDLILKNPFGFELGTILVNDSQKREAVSLEDETRFLEFVKNDPHYNRYYDAFYILFKTGLRISEVCGLTVRDLDFKNEVIRIDHQLQRTRDMKYEIVSTKTTSRTKITAYGRRCERCIPSYSEESQKDEERANSGWI